MFAKQVNWHVRKRTLLGNPLVESRMTAIPSQAKEQGCLGTLWGRIIFMTCRGANLVLVKVD